MIWLTFSPLGPGVPAPPRSPGIPPAPWGPGAPAVPTAPGSPWTENQRIMSVTHIYSLYSVKCCSHRYTHLVSIRARSTGWATGTDGSLRTSTPSGSGVTTLSLHSDTRAGDQSMMLIKLSWTYSMIMCKQTQHKRGKLPSHQQVLMHLDLRGYPVKHLHDI